MSYVSWLEFYRSQIAQRLLTHRDSFWKEYIVAEQSRLIGLLDRALIDACAETGAGPFLYAMFLLNRWDLKNLLHVAQLATISYAPVVVLASQLMQPVYHTYNTTNPVTVTHTGSLTCGAVTGHAPIIALPKEVDEDSVFVIADHPYEPTTCWLRDIHFHVQQQRVIFLHTDELVKRLRKVTQNGNECYVFWLLRPRLHFEYTPAYAFFVDISQTNDVFTQQPIAAPLFSQPFSVSYHDIFAQLFFHMYRIPVLYREQILSIHHDTVRGRERIATSRATYDVPAGTASTFSLTPHMEVLRPIALHQDVAVCFTTQDFVANQQRWLGVAISLMRAQESTIEIVLPARPCPYEIVSHPRTPFRWFVYGLPGHVEAFWETIDTRHIAHAGGSFIDSTTQTVQPLRIYAASLYDSMPIWVVLPHTVQATRRAENYVWLLQQWPTTLLARTDYQIRTLTSTQSYAASSVSPPVYIDGNSAIVSSTVTTAVQDSVVYVWA